MYSIQFNKLILHEVVIASLIAFFSAIGQSTIVSLLFAVSFILMFAYTIFDIWRNKISLAVITLIGLAAFHAIYSGISQDAIIDFNYFKKLVMFTAFVLGMYYAAKKGENLTDKIVSQMCWAPSLAGLFLVISYFVLGNTDRIAGGVILGFHNPNFTGMWLFHLFIWGFLYLKECKLKNSWRFLYILVLAAELYLIFETKARSCQLGLIIFAVLILLRRFSFRIKPWHLVVITLFPFLFYLIYMNVAEQKWFYRWFDFLISEGKTLTSRIGIWGDATRNIKNHLIIGYYSNGPFGHGSFQAHNTHVDTLLSYGLIPFVLFLHILFRNMNMVNKEVGSYTQYIAMCGFISIVFVGTFEAAVVSGSMGLNYLSIALLAIAKTRPAERPENKNSKIKIRNFRRNIK